MRRVRDKDGNRLFAGKEFLTPQQVASFLLHLAAKLRQKQLDVAPQDILAAEEQNFLRTRANVLSTLHLRHPVIVDQYDVCALLNNKSEMQRTKFGVLQHLCQFLKLEVPVAAVRRKAPYQALLEVQFCHFRRFARV